MRRAATTPPPAAPPTSDMKDWRLYTGMFIQKSGTHATWLPGGGMVRSSMLQPFLNLHSSAVLMKEQVRNWPICVLLHTYLRVPGGKGGRVSPGGAAQGRSKARLRVAGPGQRHAVACWRLLAQLRSRQRMRACRHPASCLHRILQRPRQPWISATR